jgi:hypothetical protein
MMMMTRAFSTENSARHLHARRRVVLFASITLIKF